MLLDHPPFRRRLQYDFMLCSNAYTCNDGAPVSAGVFKHFQPISIKQFKFIERVLAIFQLPPLSPRHSAAHWRSHRVHQPTPTHPLHNDTKKGMQRKGRQPYLLAISIPFNAHKRHQIKCYDFIFGPASRPARFFPNFVFPFCCYRPIHCVARFFFLCVYRYSGFIIFTAPVFLPLFVSLYFVSERAIVVPAK